MLSLKAFAMLAGVGLLLLPVRSSSAAPIASAASAQAKTATAVDADADTIRRLRLDYNAAISARDAGRMADFIAVDMVQLLSNASHQVGRGAVIASYVDEEFKDPSFIAYRRVTDDVAIGDDGLRAAERGHWQGEFRQPDGSVRGMRGLYQAGWVKRDGRWQILTEAYLRLDCGFESNCRR